MQNGITFDKIPTTQFYTVTYDMQSPFNVFGSIQDEGTFSGSINNTFGKPQDSTIRSWDYAPGGEGTQIQVDPQDHNIVFSSSFYGRLMKSDMSKPDSVQNERIKMFAVGAIDSLRENGWRVHCNQSLTIKLFIMACNIYINQPMPAKAGR